MKDANILADDEEQTSTRASRPGVERARGRKAGEATRERMLDAAEALFAKDGYHGTSMREVADRSNARIALVTYHFGTKDTLFDKVVERRASYMALQRSRARDKARKRAGSDPRPGKEGGEGDGLPFGERSTNGGQGWKNYSLLVARLANSPDGAKVISDHYDAVARQYLAEFRRSLPQAEEETVYQAFSFMVGAMVGLVAEPGRVENLSSRRFVTSDLLRAYANLLPFLVGGFDSLPRHS